MARRSPFSGDKPPRSVTVCGQRLKISYVKRINHDGIELAGLFCSETFSIKLARGPNWPSVLLHEIIHACLHFSGAREGLELDKEESIVLALEYGLKSFISDFRP